jgi:DNA-binding transcriptional ArsR family regulator
MNTDNSIYELHAEVCKALGNPLRIRIVDLLQNRELSFSDILEVTGGLKSTLSQHLSIMVSKGILHQRKKGLKAYFKLSSVKVSKACSLMREVLVENLKKQNQMLNNL